MSAVKFQQNGASGIITLNRPEALNALTLSMVRAMFPQLVTWADDSNIDHVIIEGAGDKGFCAGGDIRALHDWGQAGAPQARDFYREEYRLNRLIKTYPKPYIALMDGITMGGGVGVSVHGCHRVATQRTRFAMPETGIGLLPDVGGTYFLPRLAGALGAYLVLTGAQLQAADCCYAGITTHYMQSDQLNAVKTALAGGAATAENVAAILENYHAPPPSAPLIDVQDDINRLFVGANVIDIIDALEGEKTEWAAAQLARIASKSPTSCAVALRQMHDGAMADFDECLRIELRAVTRLMQLPDFYEGVRAIIIEKDNAPNWQPADHAIVKQADIDAIFKPLGADELSFD